MGVHKYILVEKLLLDKRSFTIETRTTIHVSLVNLTWISLALHTH